MKHFAAKDTKKQPRNLKRIRKLVHGGKIPNLNRDIREVDHLAGVEKILNNQIKGEFKWPD